jgi:hypothetical protein
MLLVVMLLLDYRTQPDAKPRLLEKLAGVAKGYDGLQNARND